MTTEPVGVGEDTPGARASLPDELEALLTSSAERVFAEPVRVGDRVVIPAARVEFSGGFGGAPAGQVAAPGGGHTTARPVAVIEAGPDGVRVKPVVDVTKVVLAALGAALTIWRATRR